MNIIQVVYALTHWLTFELFPFWAIMKKAAMNICTQVFLQDLFSFFFSNYQDVDLLNHL